MHTQLPTEPALSRTLDDFRAAEWLSAYLFFPIASISIYGGDADEAVLKILKPFITQSRKARLFEHYFFIRYAQIGPHLRLRILVRDARRREAIRTHLVRHLKEVCPAIQEVSDPLTLIGRRERSSWFLSFIPYEPEVQRYGGPESLPMAERFFVVSSDVSIALLQRIGEQQGDVDAQRSCRLGQALLAMIATGGGLGLGANGTADFFARYSNNLVSDLRLSTEAVRQFRRAARAHDREIADHLRGAWRNFKEHESVDGPLDLLNAAAVEMFVGLRRVGARQLSRPRAARDSQRRVLAVAASQIHMTNNRLGVTLGEEAYLGYIASRALRSGYAGR